MTDFIDPYDAARPSAPPSAPNPAPSPISMPRPGVQKPAQDKDSDFVDPMAPITRPGAGGDDTSFVGDVGRGIAQAGLSTARTLGLAGAGALEAVTLGHAPEALTDPIFRGIDKVKEYQDTIRRPDSVKGRIGEAVGGLVGGIPTLGIGSLSEGQDIIQSGGSTDRALAQTGLNAAANIGGLATGGLGGASRVARMATQGTANAVLGEAARVAGNAIAPEDQQREFDPLETAINFGAGVGFGLMPHEGTIKRPRPTADRVEATADAPNDIPRPTAETPAAPVVRYPDATPGSLADAANAVHEAQQAAGAPTRAAAEPSHTPEPVRPGQTTSFVADENGNLREMPRALEGAMASTEQRTPPPVPWIDQATGEVRQPTANEVKDEWHRMFEAASQAGKSTAPAASRMLSEEWGITPEVNRDMRAQAMAERKAGFRPGDQRQVEATAPSAQNAQPDLLQQSADAAPNTRQAVDEPAPAVRDATGEARDVAGTTSAEGDAGAGTTEPNRPPAQESPAAAGQVAAAKQSNDERVAALKPRVDALTEEQARTALDELGVKPSERETARDTLFAQHPDDIEQALDTLKPSEGKADAANSDEQPRVDASGKPGEGAPGPADVEGAARSADELTGAGKTAPVIERGDRVTVADGEHAGRTGTVTRAGDLSARVAFDDGSAAAIKPEALRTEPAPSAETPPKVEAAARESAAHPQNDLPEPSPAQHAANNYKQGHINLHGMDVTIQVPKGGMRRGTDRLGNDWERPASDHYGHIRGTDGGDGEPHDVYLGPRAEDPNAKVFVIDQVKPGTKAFDEKKAMIGYATGQDARRAYAANFPKDLKTFGGIKEMTLDQFKEALKPKEKPETLMPAVKGVRESKATLARRAGAAARGGVTKNGALARVKGGKLEYVPGARETLEAYFKPGDIVPSSFGGQDRVISSDFSVPHEPAVRVIAVDKEGKQLKDERERTHSTMPTPTEILKKLGAPELARDKATGKKPAEAAGQFDSAPSERPNQLGEEHYQELASAVRAATKDWGTNAPGVRVVRSAEELPDGAKRASTDRYQLARGYYDGKTAYIVARNIKDVDRALRTVVHEAVGHHGIEKIIDQHVKGGWERLVTDVQRLRDDKSLGSKAMRDTINEVERRYRNPDPTVFTKELLAVMAENGVKNGIIGRAVAALRAWVRETFPNLKFSEADLHGLLRKSDEFIRSDDVAGDARRAAVRALAFDKADPADSNAFRKFFDGSKVVDKSGQPQIVHHGTGEDFHVFDPKRAGQSGEHATAPLGHFFTEDRALAQRYAEKAADGVPAYERVIDAYLSIKKPYEMPLREAQAIETPAESRALREKLEGEGYDGIRIPEAKSWIAFDSGQAKSIDNRGSFDRQNPDIRFSMPDEQKERPLRDRGIPRGAGETAASWRNDQPLKSDPDYRAAKAGDAAAAANLVERHGQPLVDQAQQRFGSDVTYVAAHAEEASGRNKIPLALAHYLAARTGARAQDDMIQTNRAFHTGADQMERLIARSEFDGPVEPGRKYVLVDDVTTMGGTLVDLAHYIQSKGGEVVGTTTFVNAAREGGKLHADPALLKQLERRYGDAIREEFGVEPSALTASEVRYLIGFRTADELRNRATAAGRERVRRLLSKGIRLEEADQGSIKPPGDEPGSFSMPDERDRASEDFGKPQASVERLSETLAKPDETVWQQAKNWMRGKAEDFRPAALGALQTRHVLELMEDHPALKGAKQYGDLMQHLATDRNQLMAGAPDAAEHPTNMIKRGGATIAEDLRKYSYEKGLPGMMGRRRPEAKQLADVMHDATIYGLDPSEAYKKLTFQDSRGEPIEWSKEGIRERIKELRGQMRGRAGDDKSLMMDEVKRLRNLPKNEKLREQRWPELVARYGALPEEGKALYKQTRDWYAQMRDETEKGLISRIDSMSGDLGEHYTRTMKDRIRLQFEAMRREGVYFPLNRDGDFYISATDSKGRQAFLMFEAAKDAAQAEKKLRGDGFTIDAQGRRDGNYKAKDAPSGTFVSDVIGILKKANAPEKVQDDIYQLFLKTLPEMSMRKHSIHRQGIAGFSDDALRSFAKNAFHGAHQLARLRYAHQMQGVIDGMQMSQDNYRRGTEFGDSSSSSALDVARGDALLGELKKRNDYIMSPTDTSLANKANAIGFIYHLGASPASALVNLTQNAQVTLPVLGAQHGWGKATRILGAAVRDAMRTFGNIDRTLTDPVERQAYNTLRARGDIDKTQTHTLAGLAEGNLLQSSPAWAKTMSAVGYMFHKAEVINRESAGMAAFRLEYAKSKDFNKSVQYASDIINGTHFDYSAANRPRMMQNNAARIALQFKNYSIGMTWAMYRNLYQAFKGESPEVRSVARRTLTGILGMTGLMAGTMGLPIINAMRFAGNAAHTLFGDDEPFDFNTEYRAWLAKNLGDAAAKFVADGPINQLTGATFSNRVSLSNMWFQDADRELEGKDAYYAMLESIAGPLGGMTKNLYVGSKMVGDGQVERGIETMMPKFAKDAMKALRYEHEGANTLRGDPIVPDVSTPESLIQALGFTPTRLFEQQQKNSALMNYQTQITDRRKMLMNAYALAARSGSDTDTAMAKIHQFNQQYPEIAINSNSIRQSLRARARYSQEAEGGVALNKKLAPRLREEVGVGAGAQ